MRNRKFLFLIICSLCLSNVISAKKFTYDDKVVEINKNEAGKWDYNNVVINYNNGNRFVGQVDSKMNLIKGEFFYKRSGSVYTGSFNTNGQPEGEGKKVFNDGTIYEGHWVDGDFRGWGKKSFSDGSKIEGNFVTDELVSGKNSFIQWSNGASYKGETVNGVFNGVGTYSFEDGSVYTGTFIDNKRTGLGKTTYNGSSYTGHYYGDVRNRKGDFKFYNGYEYKGDFFEGTFSGTGYMLVNEDKKLIYASDIWKGAEIPKEGKIINEDGVVWEGAIENGAPVFGMGILTTQEERLVKLKEKKSYAELSSYNIGDNTIIVASVYTPEEINGIIHSASYIRDFNNFYKEHKSTFEKVKNGMLAVSGVLSVVPSPIQPFAVVANVAVASVDIALKTMEHGFELYDAIRAGNHSVIKDIALNYGSGIAWDVLDIIIMGVVPTDVSLEGLKGALKGKLSEDVIKKIIDSSLKVGGVVSVAVSALLIANPKMSETDRQLRNLKRVKDLSEKGLIQQGHNLWINFYYLDKWCHFVAI